MIALVLNEEYNNLILLIAYGFFVGPGLERFPAVADR